MKKLIKYILLNKFSSLYKRINYDIVPKNSYISLKDNYHYIPNIYSNNAHKLEDFRSDQLFRFVSDEVITSGRTLLYYDRLYNIYQWLINIHRLKADNSSFNIAEVGVYRGGTSFFLAKILSALNIASPLVLSIDTFSGHSELDIKSSDGKEGIHDCSLFGDVAYEDVVEFLKEFPFIRVIKNRVQDAVVSLGEISFDFVHLDVDLFEPTLFSLKYFADRLNDNGVIIVDDYLNINCPGVHKAVRTFISSTSSKFCVFDSLCGQCFILKLR